MAAVGVAAADGGVARVGEGEDDERQQRGAPCLHQKGVSQAARLQVACDDCVRARSASSWQTASPLPAGASRTAASRAATSSASIASRLGGLSSSSFVVAPRRIAVANPTLMAFFSPSVSVPVSIFDFEFSEMSQGACRRPGRVV